MDLQWIYEKTDIEKLCDICIRICDAVSTAQNAGQTSTIENDLNVMLAKEATRRINKLKAFMDMENIVKQIAEIK